MPESFKLKFSFYEIIAVKSKYSSCKCIILIKVESELSKVLTLFTIQEC